LPEKHELQYARPMTVTSEYVDVATPGGPMRTFVARPGAGGRFPGVLCYSDIFQLTGPMIRACTRLAGYGFVAAAPEIYHRVEPPGTVIPFDDEGRERGMLDARRTPVAAFDADCRAALDALSRHAHVASGQLAAMGFCIGGHLAFRAALQPDVKATVCFYGTGIHNGRLGQDDDAGSLARAGAIAGELVMIFGTNDPHVPAEGRATIEAVLRTAQVRHTISLYPAEHAFMRDEGPRYDPEATDAAFGEMIAFFKRVMG
jgi:carboxymethylenebutenolidase